MWRCVGAPLALVLALAAGVPAYGDTVTTQNVRAGLPRAEARHDVRQAAERSSVVFAQEMAHRRAARFAPAHWGAVHFVGPRRGDCATFYDRRVWRVVRAYPFRVSAAPFRAGHRYAVVAVLRRVGHPGAELATVNVHLFTHTVHRPRAWRRATNRLGRLVGALAAHHARVVVGGDWNRTWPRRARFPGYASAEPSRQTGPKGGRVDFLYWHGERFHGSRVIGHTYSDHEGVRVRLRP